MKNVQLIPNRCAPALKCLLPALILTLALPIRAAPPEPSLPIGPLYGAVNLASDQTMTVTATNFMDSETPGTPPCLVQVNFVDETGKPLSSQRLKVAQGQSRSLDGPPPSTDPLLLRPVIIFSSPDPFTSVSQACRNTSTTVTVRDSRRILILGSFVSFHRTPDDIRCGRVETNLGFEVEGLPTPSSYPLLSLFQNDPIFLNVTNARLLITIDLQLSFRDPSGASYQQTPVSLKPGESFAYIQSSKTPNLVYPSVEILTKLPPGLPHGIVTSAGLLDRDTYGTQLIFPTPLIPIHHGN